MIGATSISTGGGMVEAGNAGGLASQSGMSTGDYIAAGGQAAGGATQTLVSLMMGNRKKKQIKKARKIQALERERDFKEQIRQSQMNEADEIRRHDRLVPELGSEMASRGMQSSSARDVAMEDAKYLHRRRLDTLRVQRTRLRQGYEAGLKLQEIQKKIEKIEQQEAAIAATIDTVISVASILCDQRRKVNVRPINEADVLERLMRLRLATWTYDWERPDVHHVGPMAQEWYKVMGLGYNTGRIDTVDAFGVALASIKGLAEMVQAQGKLIRELQRKVDRLRG